MRGAYLETLRGALRRLQVNIRDSYMWPHFIIYLFAMLEGGEDPLVVATLDYMPGDERSSSLVFGDVRYR